MGGSLGGLSTALALRDAGCEVDVYERSRAPLRDRGAGIVLHPATVRPLGDAAGKIGVAARVLRYLGPAGTVADEQPCRYRFSSYHALYRELLARLGGARYHLGREVTGFEDAGEQVTVRLGEDAVARVDLLVCADGVRSSARARLLPDVRPAYAGYVGWRGAVPEARLAPAARATLSAAITYHVLPRGHVLAYPIPGPGEEPMLNWLWYRNVPAGAPLDDVLTDRHGRRRSASVPPGAVSARQRAALHTDAAERLPAILAGVIAATERPFVQAVCDVEVPRMAFGRVCLIGDAAFALRPHIAAGTAKAADDGRRLADAIAGCDHDAKAALREWEPGRLALGRGALARTREAGERAQFRGVWQVGEALPFGLYRQGDSELD